MTRLLRLEKGFSQADVQDNTAELGQTLRQAGNKAESTLTSQEQYRVLTI